MLSKRKEQAKTTLLNFFPAVLTTIIIDYAAEPEVKLDVSKLEKFINSHSRIRRQGEKSNMATKYYIAQALLAFFRDNLQDLDTAKTAVAYCYFQNYIITMEPYPGKLFRQPESSDIFIKEMHEDCSTYRSLTIPRVANYPAWKKNNFLIKCIYVIDEFHDVLVDLYIQCGGQVEESERDNYTSYGRRSLGLNHCYGN